MGLTGGQDFQHADLPPAIGDEIWAAMQEAAGAMPDHRRELLPADVRGEAWGEALRMVLGMARNNPDAWRCLLGYIEHLANWWYRRAARVNPRQMAEVAHGERCYNSGAAEALNLLWSRVLDPKFLEGKMESLLDKGSQRRTKTNDD